MSHVNQQRTTAGAPMYLDLACLTQAAYHLGLVKADVHEFRAYGGMQSGAEFVLRANEENRRLMQAENGAQEPYEIGIVKDPSNPGCYVPKYDPFCGGFGIDKLVGAPIMNKRGNETQLLCPKLKQMYDVFCEKAGAAEAGDALEVMTLKEASRQYPQYLPASEDEDTIVTVARTEARLAV